MAVSNIEKFDDITGKIFAVLYQHFPIPQALMAEDFVENAKQLDDFLGTEVPTEDADFFLATAEWLRQAGYINCAPDPYLYVSHAVLTAKGLEVLKAIPESVSSKESIGEQLATTAKESGKEVARGLVSEALGLGVKIFSPIIGLT
ncbi:hypothetical protein KVQ82_20830 [Pseudomonas sp. AO-1]|uniref:hypothetical protein n=1 Tax=Pseudomonas sp. AO-1 TaxID=2855434 RepID=UPI001C77771C|nr:hypothetical protein [Pseudomonas sp. AO-1]QXZ12511.1 hypothetical protein KVQ82_20830 [Pseudomonas sp. AO-1]